MGEGRCRQGRTGQVHLANRRHTGRGTPGERSDPKSGRSCGPAVDGTSGEDTFYKAQTEMEVRAAGSAHGLIVVRKEGNASRAKEPWARTVSSLTIVVLSSRVRQKRRVWLRARQHWGGLGGLTMATLRGRTHEPDEPHGKPSRE
jgi:hypothetical protein